jgi:hypothetical protein
MLYKTPCVLAAAKVGQWSGGGYTEGDTLRLCITRAVDAEKLLEPLQPTVEFKRREYVIRTAIHDPHLIAKTVETLGRACAALAIPPTNTHNGIDLSPALLAVMTGKAPLTPDVSKQIEKARTQIFFHFGPNGSDKTNIAAAKLPTQTRDVLNAIADGYSRIEHSMTRSTKPPGFAR